MSVIDLDTVLLASYPRELFSVTNKKEAKKEYLRLARAVHPDMFQDSKEKERASKAFARLGQLWAYLKEGDTLKTNLLKTRRHEYVINEPLSGDDVFARYAATFDAGHRSCWILVVKSISDVDLAAASSSALRKLRDVPEEYAAYFPTLIETFRYRQSDGDHAALAIETVPGLRSLREVLDVYPGGIDGKDVAWIFRRMLVALGNTHDIGLVHGAPNLDSIFIHPEQHGVVLSGWQYSVARGEPLRAVPAEFKDYYSESALNKEIVDYELDLAIAAKIARRLLAENQPVAMKAFFNGCQVAKLPPASLLLAEFDELLERLYGKRSFHKFTMDK